MLDVESLEGTYIEKRINESLEKELKRYKPRQGEINKNMDLYSDS